MNPRRIRREGQLKITDKVHNDATVAEAPGGAAEVGLAKGKLAGGTDWGSVGGELVSGVSKRISEAKEGCVAAGHGRVGAR